MRIAAYPGSFDPITNGHIDIVKRGLNIFDRVIIAIGMNSQKKSLLTFDERAGLISDIFKYDERITVSPFSSLIIDFVKAEKANAIIRGIRNSTDYLYEYQFAHVNSRLCPDIEHIYFMASEQDHFISSSLVKELWSYGDSYKSMVPEQVFQTLENKRRSK